MTDHTSGSDDGRSATDLDARVLVTCPLITDAIDDYAETFAARGVAYDVVEVDQFLDETDLIDRLDGYHGILAGDDELTERVFAEHPQLRVVSKWGIGTDAIDIEAAEDHGVAVYNTPGAFGDEVADVVVGYAVMLTRRLHHVDRAVREGDWHCPRGTSLAGKTAGVVGVGDIGAAVVRRFDAMGMDVLGHDVVPIDDDLRAATGVEAVDRETLFDRADLVSLHCPLTDDTRGMVDGAMLDRLGPDGYLINTARGRIVDQDALVAALEDGRIAGAALDVYETEPLPADSPLTGRDDVVLGSHNAQNTHEAVARVNERAVENLLSGLSEGR